MKIKFKENKAHSKHLNWDDICCRDIFEWGKDKQLGTKVQSEDYEEFILDLNTNQLFKYDDNWCFITKILDFTLVQNYREDW